MYIWIYLYVYRCAYIYVCKHVYVCIYIYIYIYIYVCTYVYIFEYKYVYTCISLYIYTHVNNMYMYVYIYVCLCIHVYMNTNIYTYVYIHKHTCMNAQRWNHNSCISTHNYCSHCYVLPHITPHYSMLLHIYHIHYYSTLSHTQLLIFLHAHRWNTQRWMHGFWSCYSTH